MTVSLHPATLDDCWRVWNWRNHPSARQVSFSTEPIDYDVHVVWFRAFLKRPDSRMWIAEQEGILIGVVRVDHLGTQEPIISIVLGPEYRGKGYASPTIASACLQMCAERPTRTIHALIKEGNTSSVRAFTRAGFVFTAHERVGEEPAGRYVYTNPAFNPANVWGASG